MPNYPSVKTLTARLNVDATTAKQIRAILDGTKKPDPELWRQNYNPPPRYLKKLLAINTLLDAYGVEYIAHRDDGYHNSYGLDYCNTGDTYTPTVGYNHKTGRFFVGDWGSVVERYPAQYP